MWGEIGSVNATLLDAFPEICTKAQIAQCTSVRGDGSQPACGGPFERNNTYHITLAVVVESSENSRGP